MHAVEVPAGVVVDAGEDVEDLVLLARLGEDGAGDGERADRDGRDAVVFGVRDDAADLVRVVELHGADLVVVVVRGEGVDLREQAHGCVVEEAAYDGGALDEPVVFVVQVSYVLLPPFSMFFSSQGARGVCLPDIWKRRLSQ